MTQTLEESACDAEDLGSGFGSGKSPGEGSSNPLQYSCLENPMDRGAWRATVCGIAKCGDTIELTHTYPGMRCFLFLAQLAPRGVRLQLLLPPCPSRGENCLRLEDEASDGEKQGKSGVLVRSAECLHRALPEASPVHRCFQFSLGPLVRFLPSVPGPLS